MDQEEYTPKSDQPRKEDRRSQPRDTQGDRRSSNSSAYPINEEFSDDIEIVEDKSLGVATPLSKIIEEREALAYQRGEIHYTPLHTDTPKNSTMRPEDIESLKAKLRTEIIQELDSTPNSLEVTPTPQEETVVIKPFTKKRRPGRPSSLPTESESNQWPRKTYRFNKNTLRRLKIYQAGLDDHKDLSLLINDALTHWLNHHEDL